MKGWVYILSNESFPESYKVGTTTRDPTDRLQELFTTGIPTPFILEYACLVEAAFDLEQNVHKKLDGYRVNNQREFFSCGIRNIVDVIRDEIKKNNHEILYEEYGMDGYLSKEAEYYLERGWDPYLRGWEVSHQKTSDEASDNLEECSNEIDEINLSNLELDHKYLNDVVKLFEKRIQDRFAYIRDLEETTGIFELSDHEISVRQMQLISFLDQIKNEMHEVGIREFLGLPYDFLITDESLKLPINAIFNKKFLWFKFLVDDFLVC